MTYQTPCAESNSPDDWFISRDGKQYPDEDFLTDEDVRLISLSVLIKPGETPEDHRDRVDRAVRAAEADRKRQALQRRRHAREACHECYFRSQCLDRALSRGLEHGTWGGYFEEQLRDIQSEIARRRRAKVLGS